MKNRTEKTTWLAFEHAYAPLVSQSHAVSSFVSCFFWEGEGVGEGGLGLGVEGVSWCFVDYRELFCSQK